MRLNGATPQPAPCYRRPLHPHGGPAGRLSLVLCLRRMVCGTRAALTFHICEGAAPPTLVSVVTHRCPVPTSGAPSHTVSAALRQMRCPNSVTLAPNRLYPGSASSLSSHQWVMAQSVCRIGYCVLFLADDGFAPAAVRGVTGRLDSCNIERLLTRSWIRFPGLGLATTAAVWLCAVFCCFPKGVAQLPCDVWCYEHPVPLTPSSSDGQKHSIVRASKP